MNILNLMNLLTKIYLWQVAVIVSLALLSLGFTGEIFLFEKLRAGKGTLAIYFGAMFFVLACVLRYIPPPERTIVATESERLVRVERALTALLNWLAISLGKEQAAHIKEMLEYDKTDVPTKL